MVMYLLWQLREENKIPTSLMWFCHGVMLISFFDNLKWHIVNEECVAIGKMFIDFDYKDTIDTLSPKT
jgi:hypothetical protein